MPEDDDQQRTWAVGSDPASEAEPAAAQVLSADPALLVVEAIVCGRPDLLNLAARQAATTPDRQLVALAAAHLDGRSDLFDLLVRDHLMDHPDSVVAAWIAARHRRGRSSARTTDSDPTPERSEGALQ